MDIGGAQREDERYQLIKTVIYYGGSLGARRGRNWHSGGKKSAGLKDSFIGFSSMGCSVTLPAISSMQLPEKSTLGAGTVGEGIVL